MFYHKNMASNGLSPSLISTRSIANLGTYEVTVVITPVINSPSGGGYVPAPRGQKPDRYKVTIIVRSNGNVYREEYIVDDNMAKVYAKLNGIEKFSEETMVSVNGVQMFGEGVNIIVSQVNCYAPKGT